MQSCRLHELPSELILEICEYLDPFDTWALSKVVRDVIPENWCCLNWVPSNIKYESMIPVISTVSGGFLYTPNSEAKLVRIDSRNKRQIEVYDFKKVEYDLLYVYDGHMYSFGETIKKYVNGKPVIETSVMPNNYNISFTEDRIVLYYTTSGTFYFYIPKTLALESRLRTKFSPKRECFAFVGKKFYYISVGEKLQKIISDSSEITVDDFFDYGGVNCITSHKGRIYLGLKSGNVNVYENDKYLFHFIAHTSNAVNDIISTRVHDKEDDDDSEEYGDKSYGVYGIKHRGDFLYTSGERSIKRWEEEEPNIFRRRCMATLNSFKGYKPGSVRNIKFDYRGAVSVDLFPTENIETPD